MSNQNIKVILSKPQTWLSLITIVVLILAWVVGFSSRLFAVIRFESIIHEFDPCGLTAIATYLFTKELWSSGAGLMAACFIAIVPGYISRSVAGSYDNEGIAIFALMFTYYLWVSAWGGYVYIINLIPLHVFVLLIMGRFSQKLYTAYTTFYIMGLILSMEVPFVGFQPLRTSEHMAAAGVFVVMIFYNFTIYLKTFIPKNLFKKLFALTIVAGAVVVFASVVLLTYLGYIAPWSGRFYSLWDTGYAKIHIPIIVSVSEHQPTTWCSFFFDNHVLLCAFPAGLWFVFKKLDDTRVFIILFALSAVYFAGVMVRLMLTLTPVICVLASITFSTLFDLYLKNDDEESSSSTPNERQSHQKRPVLVKNPPTDSDGDTISSKNNVAGANDTHKQMYDKAGKVLNYPTPTSLMHSKSEEQGVGSNLKGLTVLVCILLLLLFAVHCTWVTSNAYSSPSVVLSSYDGEGNRYIIDDFREAYYWLRQNTAEDATVMSWWDYGYQIAGMGNRTTLVDNNTWNNSHIALVGKAMSSNETAAYKIMRELGVDYVLVIFGGVIGFSGDDINKFLWMVRIAEGEHPQDIREQDYFTANGEFRVDNEGSPVLLNCLMYKLSYYDFGKLKFDPRMPYGFDRTRDVEIGNKNFDLKYLDEAYTTQHWLVRIYKVKDEFNRNRKRIPKLKVRHSKYNSKKTEKNKKGSLKHTVQTKKVKLI